MGNGPTPPAAAPPVAPAPPPQDLSGAGAAAAQRLETAFPAAAPPGAPAVPAAPAPGAAPPQAPGAVADTPTDFFSDEAMEGLDFGGLQYRDGKKLENEIRRARDTYKPFNDAFAAMSPDARQALLDGAPTLGDDLATFTNLAGGMHPDDRAWYFAVMQKMQTDPAGAAQLLADGAEILRGGPAPAAAAPVPPGTEPMPEWAQPPAGELPAAEQPLTRAQLDQPLNDRDFQQTVKAEENRLLAKARELGYDPESKDPTEFARFNSLIALAGRPEAGGDFDKAHALMLASDQAIIDRFVAGKQADASRPGAPADAGAPPAQLRELVTTDDARAAMENRMDSVLGPDQRRRSDE